MSLIKLIKKNDQVYAVVEGNEPQEVRIVYLRPLSGMGREISIIGKKEELVCVKSLDELDGPSQIIAKQELESAYYLPRITAIAKTETHFGNRYFYVETNKGPAQFLLKNPYVSVRWVTDDEAIIIDAMNNRFHIPSVKNLDPRSRQEFLKVL
ncbi:MAG: DUF1854 domain-containing protein [Chitinivibrionales bacterium]|nr:DUF1854 domain-containing protein [Chitinivibrionales bacterium]